MSELSRQKRPQETGDKAADPRLELEATLTHHFSQPERETRRLPTAGSKQDLDLATAIAMLRGGMINERQLAHLAANWTTFGTTGIAEHALQQGMISEEQSREASTRGRGLLQEAVRLSNGASRGGTRERGWRARLDPSGRISRHLGVGDEAMLVGDEVEDRSLGARYTLLRKLGQGGLGTVWLARDENLNRYVALKEISGDAGPQDSAQHHFRREAEITGRLEHPGIVPIYQFGRDETTGKSFYVMRFMGRRTLQDAIAEYHERLESGDADTSMMLHRLLTAFVSVCHAVGHAHARRIIHRDLKPANVALDEFGQVTLLDWGLAKVNEQTGLYDIGGRAEPGDLHSMGSTAIGRVIGTPLYMAPEQASGRLEDVDELTDVYGLGGMLYAILTGVGPHQATVDTIATKLAASEVLSRIVAEPITPPEKLSKATPPELNAICLKALSGKPYLRYSSACELAKDVERFLAGTPVHAYQAPLKRRVSRWMSKHPTLAQVSLLVVSLIVILGIAVTATAWQGRNRLVSARYATAVETARDLEVNLKFVAQELERDLHFITELPLMSAIIQSQRSLDTPAAPGASGTPDAGVGRGAPDARGASAGQPAGRMAERDAALAELPPRALKPAGGGGGAVDLSNFAPQSPAQWLDRQGELFDGFLNANPGYLMMASCVRDDDDSFRELVRSERVAAGLRIHRVPRKQLLVTSSEVAQEESDLIEALRPGAVLLTTNDQISEDIPTNNRSPLVLTGISATYDGEGDFFGINVIESDLRDRLQNLLPAVTPEYINVCVTDSQGMIVMDYKADRFTEPAEAVFAGERFPQLGDLFRTGAVGGESGDGKTFYATIAQLGSRNSRARVGIIAYVVQPRVTP